MIRLHCRALASSLASAAMAAVIALSLGLLLLLGRLAAGLPYLHEKSKHAHTQRQSHTRGTSACAMQFWRVSAAFFVAGL